MSTNGIIARSTGEGTFADRYHHWDSFPSGLGVALVELYRGHFKRDLQKMLSFLQIREAISLQSSLSIERMCEFVPGRREGS